MDGSKTLSFPISIGNGEGGGLAGWEKISLGCMVEDACGIKEFSLTGRKNSICWVERNTRSLRTCESASEGKGL